MVKKFQAPTCLAGAWIPGPCDYRHYRYAEAVIEKIVLRDRAPKKIKNFLFFRAQATSRKLERLQAIMYKIL